MNWMVISDPNVLLCDAALIVYIYIYTVYTVLYVRCIGLNSQVAEILAILGGAQLEAGSER